MLVQMPEIEENNEQPMVIIEHPSIAEQSSIAILEMPSIVSEQPEVIIEHSAVVIEHRAVVIEQPVAVIEQPVVVFEMAKSKEEDLLAAALNAFSGGSVAAPESEASGSAISSKKEEVCKPKAAPVAEKPKEPSLYEQFGGSENMAAFVDEWMGNVLVMVEDPDQKDMLREKMFQFFKFKLDGSKRYLGRDLAEVHRYMGITDAHFDDACAKMLDSLKKVRIKATTKFKPAIIREFHKRISALRDQICFPPIEEHKVMDSQMFGPPTDNLLASLGAEQGLSILVQTMVAIALEKQMPLFDRMLVDVDPQVFASKYSIFLASCFEKRFEWYYEELVRTKQINGMLLDLRDFDNFLGLMNGACVQQHIGQEAIMALLEIMELNRQKLCLNEQDQQLLQ